MRTYVERMFQLRPGDLDPRTGRPYEGPPLQQRYACLPSFPLRLDGVNEYESIARYRLGTAYEEVAADFVIDLDNVSCSYVTEVLNLVGKFVTFPLLYSSGAKGYHIVVPWEALGLPEGDWKPRYRAFVQSHGIAADLSVYRPRSLLRVPGSVNARTGRRKRLIRPEDVGDPDAREVEVGYAVGDATKLREWLLQASPAEEREPPERDEPVSGWDGMDVYVKLRQLGTPDCVQKLYFDGIPAPGLRNATYHTLASYYRSSGKSLEEAQRLAEEFAALHSANTQTPLRQRVAAARETVRAVYRLRHKFSCRRTATELGICNQDCPLNRTT
jgi:hypothetical protein